MVGTPKNKYYHVKLSTIVVFLFPSFFSYLGGFQLSDSISVKQPRSCGVGCGGSYERDRTNGHLQLQWHGKLTSGDALGPFQ